MWRPGKVGARSIANVRAGKVATAAAPLVPRTVETRQHRGRPRGLFLQSRYRCRPTGRCCTRPGWCPFTVTSRRRPYAWDPGSRRHICDARVCLTGTSKATRSSATGGGDCGARWVVGVASTVTVFPNIFCHTRHAFRLALETRTFKGFLGENEFFNFSSHLLFIVLQSIYLFIFFVLFSCAQENPQVLSSSYIT